MVIIIKNRRYRRIITVTLVELMTINSGDEKIKFLILNLVLIVWINLNSWSSNQKVSS